MSLMDMVCNFRKCRRSLSAQAWVTTCSHAFCVEHGKREFKRSDNSLICPACGTELSDKFDVIQADLQPGETFKSIVLAGLKPDLIMDIAKRAISFWSYQMEQETLYQESLNKHSKEKLECFEEVSTIKIKKLKGELVNYQQKIASLQSEYNKKKKQAEELKSQLEEKSRLLHKLTIQCDSHKRKNFHNNFTVDHGNQECMEISDLVVNRANTETFVFKPIKDGDHRRKMCSPKTPMFDFRNKNKQVSDFQFRPFHS